MVGWRGLTNSWERREVKGKGQKARHIHLNAEFQRIARRDKRAFLSEQCKEIEEDSWMEKTRYLFKKIRDTKGTFHAKMGTINDRNGMDLIEVEDTKKKWQEYTEELYKKDLNDPDNHNVVITPLEPDMLESEVKWALGSITTNKTSGGEGSPVELFSTLKRWHCESVALNMPTHLENSAVATGLEKVCFHSNPKERQCQRMLKLRHNSSHIVVT